MKQFLFATVSVGVFGSGPTRLEDAMPQLGFLMEAAQAELARDHRGHDQIVQAMRRRFETEMLGEEKTIGTALTGYASELASQRRVLEEAVNASVESLEVESLVEPKAGVTNSSERTRLRSQLNSAERALKLSAVRDGDALLVAQQQAGGLFEDLGQKLSTKIGDVDSISNRVEQLLAQQIAAVPPTANATSAAEVARGITRVEAQEVDAAAKAGKKYQDFFRKVTKEAYTKEAKILQDLAAQEKLEVARLLTATPVPAHVHRKGTKLEYPEPREVVHPRAANDELAIASERSASHKAVVKEGVAALDRLSAASASASASMPQSKKSSASTLKVRKTHPQDHKAAAVHKSARKAALKKAHEAATTTSPAPTTTVSTTTTAAPTTTMSTTTLAPVTEAATTTTRIPLALDKAARLLGATTFQKLAAQKGRKEKVKLPQDRKASAMHKALRGRHLHHTK